MRKGLRLLFALVLVGSFTFSLHSRSNASAIEEGTENPTVKFYKQRCSMCHGVDGHPQLSKMPDFTDPEFQNEHSDEDLLKSIMHGKSPRMPSFKAMLDEEKAKALVAHIRTFAKKEEVEKKDEDDKAEDSENAKKD